MMNMIPQTRRSEGAMKSIYDPQITQVLADFGLVGEDWQLLARLQKLCGTPLQMAHWCDSTVLECLFHRALLNPVWCDIGIGRPFPGFDNDWRLMEISKPCMDFLRHGIF